MNISLQNPTTINEHMLKIQKTPKKQHSHCPKCGNEFLGQHFMYKTDTLSQRPKCDVGRNRHIINRWRLLALITALWMKFPTSQMSILSNAWDKLLGHSHIIGK